MAENIFRIFVYLFGAVLLVTVIDLCIAMLQYLEDIPLVRKQIWKMTNHSFRKTHDPARHF